MMQEKIVQAALHPEALYEKSKVYIQRALKAHNDSDLDQYQLWASLSMELLGKARLAQIHPSLIVDPNHSLSLFAASGFNITTDIKTITWKTLFERLQKLSPRFDTNVKDFCDTMAQRRNAELHSGELPFHSMRLESWEGRFWQATQHVLETMDYTLEQWLGANEAKAPKELVERAIEVTRKAAIVKRDDAKDYFAKLKKKEREDIIASVQSKTSYSLREHFSFSPDKIWEVKCPACESVAYMAGMQYEEVVLDDYDYENPWVEYVARQFFGEEFRCLVCNLRLNGQDEMEAVKLDLEFEEVEDREREFEPDYGND